MSEYAFSPLKKCPTCRAKYDGNPTCRRCGMDLGRLADILRRAAVHLVEARIACLEKDYPEMLRHARRAVSLYASDESLKTLASAELLNRNFEDAHRVYMAINRKRENED